MTKSANGFAPEDIARAHGLCRYVMIRKPDKSPTKISSGPHMVIHDTGRKAWIFVTHAEELDPEIRPVGDGTDNGYSTDGDRIVSVPVEWCSFITESEALSIVECMAIDESMLANAR